MRKNSRRDPPRSWREEIAVSVVSLLASVAGLPNQFAFDDVLLVQQNARVHDLDHIREILTRPYWPPPFNPELYRPIASFVVAIQYVIGNGAPVFFRVSSYVLYAAVALGVLALGRRLLGMRGGLIAALLFAAHPVHVESVALAVNQGELIVALLTLLLLTHYLDIRAAGNPDRADWAAFAALYVTAALTKEHAFVLPALLMAAEWLLVAPELPLAPRVRRLWPGFAALSLAGLAALILRTVVLAGNVSGTFTAEALQGVGIRGRALTMLGVVPVWLRLLAWPKHLQVDYSPGEIVTATRFGLRQVAGSLVIVSAGASLLWFRRRAAVVTFGIAWLVITLLPVSNVLVPTGIVVAERTLFLPSFGFLLSVVALARWVVRSVPVPTVPLRRLGYGCVGLLVVLGVLRSAERHTVWRNDYQLWMTSTQDAPRSFRVSHAVGDLLFVNGQTQEAIRIYDRAIEESVAPWKIREDFARRLHEVGNDTAAVVQLRLSLAEEPDQPVALIELATDLIGEGDYAGARSVVNRAIERGDDAPVLAQLGHVADSAATHHLPPGSVHLTLRLDIGNALSGGAGTQPPPP